MVFVDRGESAEVNGRKFTGPLYIARQSTLREVSFVALGADDQTVARMAADSQSSSNQIEVQSMEFEQWVAAQGFEADTLTEQQSISLRALFDQESQVEAAETMGPSRMMNLPLKPERRTLANRQTRRLNLRPIPIDIMRSRWTAERKRISAISQLFAGKHPDLEARAVEQGWDQNRCRTGTAPGRASRSAAGLQ